MRAVLASLVFLLMGCPISWESEADSLRKQEDWDACHFTELDIEIARPDGYPCRQAACSDDGTHYWQRGVCSQLGTVCLSPSEPTHCSPDEICMLIELPGIATQAICMKKDLQ